eukprot:TRINITY_DN43573_c0_g1_i1.p1 TRINITY_DN43573_c0_g1~~TRINITY_DN43573_c0_g1_i1.p1  ORF type:complete len:1286 (+),score=188.76 TRINITY_DN43573_c0_g1_i1:151-4008(+)
MHRACAEGPSDPINVDGDDTQASPTVLAVEVTQAVNNSAEIGPGNCLADDDCGQDVATMNGNHPNELGSSLAVLVSGAGGEVGETVGTAGGVDSPQEAKEAVAHCIAPTADARPSTMQGSKKRPPAIVGGPFGGGPAGPGRSRVTAWSADNRTQRVGATSSKNTAAVKPQIQSVHPTDLSVAKEIERLLFDDRKGLGGLLHGVDLLNTSGKVESNVMRFTSSTARLIDGVMLFVLLVSCISAPLSFLFGGGWAHLSGQSPQGDLLLIVDIATDVLYGGHLLLRLNMSCFDSQFCLEVVERRKIRHWHFTNITYCLKAASVTCYIWIGCGAPLLLNAVKIVRCLEFVKPPASLFHLRNSPCVCFGRFALLLLLCGHWVACLLVSVCGYREAWETHGAQLFVTRLQGSDVHEDISMYFMALAEALHLLTGSLGDPLGVSGGSEDAPSPRNRQFANLILAVLLAPVGLAITAIAVTVVFARQTHVAATGSTGLLSSVAGTDATNLPAMLWSSGVPDSLQERLKNFQQFQQLTQRRPSSTCALLGSIGLSPPLEVALRLQLCQNGGAVMWSKMLLSHDVGCVMELLLALEDTLYLPGDYVVRHGEPGKGLCILSSGRLSVLPPRRSSSAEEVVGGAAALSSKVKHLPSQGSPLCELHAGTCFGEAAILKAGVRHTAWVRSDTFSVILLLRRQLAWEAWNRCGIGYERVADLLFGINVSPSPLMRMKELDMLRGGLAKKSGSGLILSSSASADVDDVSEASSSNSDDSSSGMWQKASWEQSLSARALQVPCTFRTPKVGDVVFSVDGLRVAKDVNGHEKAWQLGVGDSAIVVEVDGEGDFRLKRIYDRRESGWQVRKNYLYAPEGLLSCAMRAPFVGERVISKAGERVARNRDGRHKAWRLAEGDFATVVDIDADGDFRLKNRYGVESLWQLRGNYLYEHADGGPAWRSNSAGNIVHRTHVKHHSTHSSDVSSSGSCQNGRVSTAPSDMSPVAALRVDSGRSDPVLCAEDSSSAPPHDQRQRIIPAPLSLRSAPRQGDEVPSSQEAEADSNTISLLLAQEVGKLALSAEAVARSRSAGSSPSHGRVASLNSGGAVSPAAIQRALAFLEEGEDEQHQERGEAVPIPLPTESGHPVWPPPPPPPPSTPMLESFESATGYQGRATSSDRLRSLNLSESHRLQATPALPVWPSPPPPPPNERQSACTMQSASWPSVWSSSPPPIPWKEQDNCKSVLSLFQGARTAVDASQDLEQLHRRMGRVEDKLDALLQEIRHQGGQRENGITADIEYVETI